MKEEQFKKLEEHAQKIIKECLDKHYTYEEAYFLGGLLKIRLNGAKSRLEKETALEDINGLKFEFKTWKQDQAAH